MNGCIKANSVIPCRIFGTKENHIYYDRAGAYIIPRRGELIAVVRTPKGLFLIGGGIEKGEDERQCLRRECMEETGYNCVIGERFAAAETFTRHKTVGWFHPIQSYYSGELGEWQQEKIEPDHTLLWLTYPELKDRMFSEMQLWAIKTLLAAKNE